MGIKIFMSANYEHDSLREHRCGSEVQRKQACEAERERKKEMATQAEIAEKYGNKTGKWLHWTLAWLPGVCGHLQTMK
jgi:hypothetical protein